MSSPADALTRALFEAERYDENDRERLVSRTLDVLRSHGRETGRVRADA